LCFASAEQTNRGQQEPRRSIPTDPGHKSRQGTHHYRQDGLIVTLSGL
jgi:hypothetical protein